MSDQEDLELEALQRRLDDAFETTRPRRGFEDDLWLRIQVRRPFWTRLQDAVAGFVQAFRESPAVPMAATAAVLVVVIGVGIVSLGRLGGGTGGGASTAVSNDHSGSGAAAGPAGAPLAANAHAQGSFGNLPRPQGSSAGPVPSPSAFGPQSIAWTGHLSLPITSAPVFRYYEPTTYEADQFANALGASSVQGRAGFLGTYAGGDLNVQVRGSFPPAQEPYFYVTPNATKVTSVTAATDAADAFLSAHSLVPSWPYTVTAATTGNFTKLHYLRQFAVPSLGNVSLVDGNGDTYGMEVDVRSGQVVTVMGPLPLNMDSAIYPIISADQAVSLALSTACQSCPRQPSVGAGVQLDKADLVYVLVVTGNQGFYEPAILFSGTSSANGTAQVIHVLVPAVDQSQLTP